MKIFCDTNIIIEFLCRREQANLIERILRFEPDQNQYFISIGSFYTITFIIEKYLRKNTELSVDQRLEKLREILLSILYDFNLASLPLQNLKQGVNDSRYIDLEDSYQYQAAISSQCDVLLTINKKDFSSSDILSIYTPQEFIEKYLV